MTSLRHEAQEYFRGLRDRICARLEQLDGGRFVRRAWTREGGGGGEMSELRGEVFEKGGCNFSVVSGSQYPGAVASGAQAEGSERRQATRRPATFQLRMTMLNCGLPELGTAQEPADCGLLSIKMGNGSFCVTRLRTTLA